MNSKKPTTYFKKILSTLPERKISFYQDIQSEYEVVKINKVEESFTYLEPDAKGIAREFKIYFVDGLKRDLERAYIFYKDAVNNDFREDIPEDKFLKFHKQLLKDLRVRYVKENIGNPIIEGYFQRCEQYLLELIDPDQYYMDTSSLSKDEIILATFSYLKGKNKNGKQIMTTEEHSRLMNMVFHLVEKEEAPIIEKPIEEINIKRDLLKFTFWVLHKELYTTTPIRRYFYDFLLSGFEQLNDNSMDSLSSSFTRGKNTFSHPFIPPIIKKHLNK